MRGDHPPWSPRAPEIGTTIKRFVFYTSPTSTADPAGIAMPGLLAETADRGCESRGILAAEIGAGHDL